MNSFDHIKRELTEALVTFVACDYVLDLLYYSAISIGKFRIRTPVAAKMAFLNAGATGDKPDSPTPQVPPRFQQDKLLSQEFHFILNTG